MKSTLYIMTVWIKQPNYYNHRIEHNQPGPTKNYLYQQQARLILSGFC
ncbi:MAG: hypothetical protein JWP37_2653 [Mucilaginibacter sp.]|nr:hypothetical protein [Mucilaginibacter sp.]